MNKWMSKDRGEHRFNLRAVGQKQAGKRFLLPGLSGSLDSAVTATGSKCTGRIEYDEHTIN